MDDFRPRLATPPLLDGEIDEFDDYFEDEFSTNFGDSEQPPIYAEPLFLHETKRVAAMPTSASVHSDLSERGWTSDATSNFSIAQSEGGWMLNHHRKRRIKRSLPRVTTVYKTRRTTARGVGGLLGLGGRRSRETVVDCGAIVSTPSG